ncbi:MAG TPA: DNA mismatch repair protein MutS, partial [Opitutales bacterium]|nr:DNA mismatch repair protein MutS [Opitutales bacterium]
EVKKKLPPNTLLLFRLGDFYELFYEDAELGAEILGITLTKRHLTPMAGIPHHAAENYISKLLEAGKKIAICEQTEPARPGRLVKRSLARIITPGTAIDPNQIEQRRNCYIVTLDLDGEKIRAAWMDLSTAEFTIAAESAIENLLPVLAAIDPREIVVPTGSLDKWRSLQNQIPALEELLAFGENRLLSELDPFHFEQRAGAKNVIDSLGVLNLDGFGIDLIHPALGPAGALIAYVTENLCARPENLRNIREYRSDNSLLLDPATLRNLEILESSNRVREGSLLDVIDGTTTAAGARLLENFLAAPILDLAEITRRRNCVSAFTKSPASISLLQEKLKSVRDLSRIVGRLQNRLRNPRELGAIRETLIQLPDLRSCIYSIGAPELDAIADRIDESPQLLELLQKALLDDLPAQLLDGGYIRPDYDSELNRMLSLTSGNKKWLSDLEQAEQKRTGIRNLKVKFNNAFGYFIEVTKANLHLVPDDYIRRQTTVNAERYYTDELKEKEKEIFHAEENARARELELFSDLVGLVLKESDALTQTADALAELDVFLGWAAIAREWNYCCPEIDNSNKLEIVDGRHPVVEQTIRREHLGVAGNFSFVPNDTKLDSSGTQIMLITGPNMAGKSTYIRQVALITLMAQIGCWVPAKSCRIGLVDRIFSRVGASDELARGNSTFMVEMNETANILNNATDRSLIILDEIGRGTSTYDGLSIAWAVVEHLHHDAKSGPRTLFATHYHELTQLEKSLPRLRNFSVAVKEHNEEIIFVRQVIAGAADRSYGIQVARLAGLPSPVIARAQEILQKLESDDTDVTLTAPAPRARLRKKIRIDSTSAQLDLFSEKEESLHS